MEDEAALEFLRKAAASAKYVTSVCTGSLVLGAAGLLKGKRATSHWSVVDHLALLGAIPTHERVVVDGNIVTGAGVLSGIDFALPLAAILDGEQVAREIQLQIEYDPDPPFDSGSLSEKAAPDLLAMPGARRPKSRTTSGGRSPCASGASSALLPNATCATLAAGNAMQLFDHAAGDAAAGIAGRIGLVVVAAGMDHDGRAVGVEHRVRLAFLERDGGVHHLDDGQFRRLRIRISPAGYFAAIAPCFLVD